MQSENKAVFGASNSENILAGISDYGNSMLFQWRRRSINYSIFIGKSINILSVCSN